MVPPPATPRPDHRAARSRPPSAPPPRSRAPRDRRRAIAPGRTLWAPPAASPSDLLRCPLFVLGTTTRGKRRGALIAFSDRHMARDYTAAWPSSRDGGKAKCRGHTPAPARHSDRSSQEEGGAGSTG